MPNEVAEVRPTTPLQLLQAAVERGVDPDKLGKLTDLVERWEINRASSLYAAALTGFQADCPPVIKRRAVKNNSGKEIYKFANYDDVMDVAGPFLARYGIVVTFSSEPAEKGVKMTCRVRVGTHFEDSTLTVAIPKLTGGANATQEDGASLTYVKRYALCNALNIRVVGEDNDAATLEGGNIGPEEIATLNEGIEAAQENGKIREIGRFFVWCAKIAGLDTLDSLEDLPRSAYQRVKAELDQMRKAVRK